MWYLLVLILLKVVGGITADCSYIKERYPSGTNTNTYEAMKFLTDINRKSFEIYNKLLKVDWAYGSNQTEFNKEKMMNATLEIAEFTLEAWKNATSFAWKDFKNESELVYRWFKISSDLGSAALPEHKRKEMKEISTEMTDIFVKMDVYRDSPPLEEFEPINLLENPVLMEAYRKEAELKYYWSQWRVELGKKMRNKYIRYIELSNEVACLNGFNDNGEYLQEPYESKTFVDEVEELWQTVKPLYEQLHAYARRKLIRHYPHLSIKADGPIPAHLLDTASWNNIFDIAQPFPNKKFVSIRDIEIQKKMTRLDMFKLSEDFFASLGLPKMTPEFWHYSIIEKPEDREIACDTSAWDFYDGKDYRIKMCAELDMEDLITIHHEMGHVVYFMLYSQQLFAFHTGTNPGFHEAIGDTIALSVATRKHLATIGLADDIDEDYENDINVLMNMAFDKIAFIPLGYLVDAWRWKVYNGSISSEELNAGWWNMRLQYQGLCPPMRRTEEDFDAGSQYHIAADVPYIRYFVSHIIQFQFHKALCDASGFKGPLHKCDIYRSKKAGQLLSDMLSLGNSVHWNEAMRIITQGKTTKMDAGPIMEYFAPLMEWLKEQNKDEVIGWKSRDPMQCP